MPKYTEQLRLEKVAGLLCSQKHFLRGHICFGKEGIIKFLSDGTELSLCTVGDGRIYTMPM